MTDASDKVTDLTDDEKAYIASRLKDPDFRRVSMLDAIKTLHAELAAARAKVDETIKEAKTGRPSLDKEAAAAAIVAASVSELTTALVGVSGAFSAQFDTFQTSQDANTKAATKLQRWMVGLTWALFLAAAVQAVGMWIGHSTPPPIVMVVGATQK